MLSSRVEFEGDSLDVATSWHFRWLIDEFDQTGLPAIERFLGCSAHASAAKMGVAHPLDTEKSRAREGLPSAKGN